MSDFHPSRYLVHFGGISALLAWAETWRSQAREITIDGPQVLLGATASRRFGLAVPKSSRYASMPSLLAQKDEALWLEAIRWDRVVVDPENRRLWLRSAFTEGDQRKWPDLPAFAVGILVDFPEKLMPLLRFKGLELRGLWREEEQWRIDAGPARARWRVEERSKEGLFRPGENAQGRSFADLVAQRLTEGNRVHNPGFQGGFVIPADVRAQMEQELKDLDADRTGR